MRGAGGGGARTARWVGLGRVQKAPALRSLKALGPALPLSTQSPGLSFPLPINGKLPRKRTGRPHSTELRAFLCTVPGRGHGASVPQTKAASGDKAKDTSMRFTMLRHDSRLKPLVRRSLSARKSVPTPQPTRFQGGAPGGRGWGSTGPWRRCVKSSKVGVSDHFYR